VFDLRELQFAFTTTSKAWRFSIDAKNLLSAHMPNFEAVI